LGDGVSNSNVSASLPKRGGLARNLFHLGLGQVTTTALTMVMSAIVARTLGASDYGLFYLIASVAGFAYVFVDWGHGPYVTREVAIHPQRSGELMGSVLVVRTGTAVVMSVVAVFAMWLLGYEGSTAALAVLLIFAWIPQYLGLSYCWAFRGHERMEFDALLQVVLKLSTVIVGAIVLLSGGRVLALIFSNAAAGAITLATAFLVYKHLGFPAHHISRATAKELLRDGAPMLAISVAVAAQPSIDANILYKLVPTHVLGWYAAAWQIAGTLVAPATILGAGMYPRLSRASSDRLEFARVLRTGFRPLLLLAVLGCVGTYLFADVAIGLIFSLEKFGPSVDILHAFAVFLMLIYIDMLFGHALVAANKAAPLAKAKMAAIAVTTAVELLVVPYFQSRFGNGGIGIVFALACGELVMIGSSVWLIRHAIGKDMGLDVVRGLSAGIVTLGIMWLLPPVTPFIRIPLCVAVFAAMAFVSGAVNRSDAELLLASVGRKRGQVPPEAAAIESVVPGSTD
jgi:O-antigen/teichoic acid export membrane protein